MSAFLAIAAREARTGYAGGGAGLVLAFLVLVAALFPFAVGPDAALLARVGGGVVWTAALLAALLPVERLVAPDLASGVVDQLLVRGHPLALVMAAKAAGHWLAFAPPLMAATLVAAALLGLPGAAAARVVAGLAVATPALAALGVATAAFTATLRGAGGVAGLVMLPAALPLLIFGAGAVDGGPAAFKLLAAASLLVTAGAPVAAAAAVRAGLD